MCVCVSVSVCGGQRSLRGICCAADAEKPLALSDTHGGSVSNTLTCLFSCRGQRSHHRAGWVAHSRAGDLQLHERVREKGRQADWRREMCLFGWENPYMEGLDLLSNFIGE